MTKNGDLPLKGIRILDLTTVVMGPYTTQILGDLGAEVIKIEEPNGDMTRYIGASRNEQMSSLFLGANRNKKSITLNLKEKMPKEALWKLIKSANVFVHNIRPQKIYSLGFDPDSVIKENQNIVYCGLHGYAEEGPYGGKPAYDDVIQGQSGIAGTFIARDGSPSLVPSIVADKSIGLLACTSILAALIKALRTGHGSYLEVSMFEGMAGYTLVEHQHGDTFFPSIDKVGYPRLISKFRRPYKTQDGYLCMLAYTDKQWKNFWRINNLKENIEDTRFKSAYNRAKNIDILYKIVSEILLTKRNKDWLNILDKAEIPSGVVNKLEDLKEDPQLKAINFFREFNHPTEGQMRIPDTGIRIDRKTLPIRLHQPNLGEHSIKILSDLGYSKEKIQQILKSNGK